MAGLPLDYLAAAQVMEQGGLIAYPTEAVYGLGCDPANAASVHRLLALKHRPVAKGLILIAADLGQLEPYLLPLPSDALERVSATWPGPVTWLLPVHPRVPAWLKGSHDTLAVRVTAHPDAAELCRAFGGPVVSTSANTAGQPPLRQSRQVVLRLGRHLDGVLMGRVGGAARPTEIRALDGRIVRQG